MTERDLRCDAVTVIRTDPQRGERTILNDVSVTLKGGHINLITGPTGAGKSTFIHVLGGLLRPTSGTVYAGETPVSRWVAGHRDRWRRAVGIALQTPHLLPDLTVLENVLVPLVPRVPRVEVARARARQALLDVDLDRLAGAAVTALSGGQRQRVALARALVVEPEYLLVDEPSAHQDDSGTHRILAALSSAKTRGAVVVVTAHDPRVVDSDAPDRRFHLDDGQLRTVDEAAA